MGLFKKEDTNYRPALKWLQYMYPTLHSHVLNLGKPEYRYDLPTAAVEHVGEGAVASTRSHYFKFVINPTFEKTLGSEDYAFVLSHESFHILLGHLAVYDKYDNPKRFNIATDCIINDWLYNFGIEPTNDMKPLYGPDIVGFDTSQSSLDEIYKLIPDEMAEGDCDKCNGNCTGEPDESGEPGTGTCTCPQTVDDHGRMFGDGSDGHGQGQIDPSQVDKAIKDFVESGGFDKLHPIMKDFIFDNNEVVRHMKQENRPSGGWSPTGFGMSVSEQLAEGVDFKWAELMQTITPDLYNAGVFNTSKSRSFARPNKKTMTIYPKVILPSSFFESGGHGRRPDKDENTFVLALDHSGSVSNEDKRKFQALANSIPQSRARVFACTFSTSYVSYDINGGPGQPVAGGGTDFGAVEQFVQQEVVKELGKYPKAIVVITDGYATFGRSTPNEDQLERNWYWLITGGTVRTSCERINRVAQEHMFNLDRFVK